MAGAQMKLLKVGDVLANGKLMFCRHLPRFT